MMDQISETPVIEAGALEQVGQTDSSGNYSSIENAPPVGIDERKAMAAAFLKALDPTAELFTFQTFDDKGRESGRSPLILHGSIDEHFDLLAKRNSLGQGIFVTVNKTDLKGRKEKNLTAVRAIYQEDDNGFDGRFPLAPSLIVASSPGKFHRYWLLDTPNEEALKSARMVEERMVEEYGSDPAAKDVARVLRLPGFYNTKVKYEEPQLVEVIAQSDKRYSWGELINTYPPVEIAPKTRKKRAVKVSHAVAKDDEEVDLDRLRTDLFTLDPGMDRDDWLNLLFACHSIGQYDMFKEWSKQWVDYDDEKFHAEWHSPTRGGQHETITYRTIHFMANELRKNGSAITPAQIAKLSASRPKAKSVPSMLLSPPGLVGELAAHFESTVVRPQPVFAVSAALSTLSVAADNGWLVEALKTPLALYTALIGGTASGKDGPRGCIQRTLRAVGSAGSVVDALSSGPALMTKLADEDIGHNVILLTDEFGKVLKSSTSHGDSLQTEYMSVYGRGNDWFNGKDYAKKENNIPPYYGPYLNIVGTTTQAALVEALTSTSVVDGFLNRFMLVIPPAGIVPMRQTIPPKDLSSQLQARLVSIKEFAEINDEPTGILYEDGVLDMCIAYSAQADVKADADTSVAPLWGRAFQNSIAVAGILAIGNDSGNLGAPVITRELYEWATTWVSWCCESACEMVVDHVADDKEEKDRKKIFRFIKDCRKYAGARDNTAALADLLGKGLAPRAWISRKTRISSKRIDEAILTLQDSMMLEIQQTPGGNHKPIVLYKAI